jgi:AcrR family transcriptional regulator
MVLQAAVELLADEGVRKLTQPQVAERAGVRQSHVTYYFPKRSDLVGAVARRYVESAAVEILQLFSRAESEDLGALLLEFTYRQVADERRSRTLMGLLVASEEDPALREQLVEAVLRLRAVIAQALGKDADDPAVVILQATLWGLGINNLLMRGGAAEARVLVDRVAEQLLPKKRKGRR